MPSPERTTEAVALRARVARCLGLNDARQSSTKRLLQEHPERTYWMTVLRHIGLSPFCRGHNPRGWTANFDFLIRRTTHLKVLEGRYDHQREPLDAAGMLRANGWLREDVE